MTRLRLRQAALLTRPVTRSLQHLPLLACPALAFAAATLPQDPGLGARLAAVAVGLSTVFLLDDPAAATVAPSPRTLGFRRVHRLAIWLPVLAALWALLLWRTRPPEAGLLSLQLAAFVSVAVSAAAGLGGALAGPIVVGLFVVEGIVMARAAKLADGGWAWGSWALVLVAGVTCLAWLSRDPGG